jgi:EAL domain-containing protein (putative c-di-GMP-specific phosphodiesterase class I)
MSEQIEYLKQQGCDEYQGFYCSPALPASRIPDLVAGFAELAYPSTRQ